MAGWRFQSGEMSPHSKRIGAVILAAGGSSRFGQPKQLIPFRGKPLFAESSMPPGIETLTNSSPAVEATALLVCDQPAVDVRVVQRLIALHETTGKTIVASNYVDTLGVPALFTRSVFQELLSLADKAGAKSIVCEVASALCHYHFPKARLTSTLGKIGKSSMLNRLP